MLHRHDLEDVVETEEFFYTFVFCMDLYLGTTSCSDFLLFSYPYKWPVVVHYEAVID